MRQRARALAVVATSLLLAGCRTGTPSARPSHAASSGAATVTSVATPTTQARHPRLRATVLPWRLPRPLSREAVMPSGRGRVVVAGGLGPGDISTAATYTLDLRSGQATRGRPLATAVHDTAGAVLPGERMVIGGGGTTEQSAVQVATPGRWRVHGHLPTTRSDLAAVATGGKVYVVGGYDGRTPALAEVLVSADGRRWRRFARLPEPVRYPGVVVARGAIWVFGGERGGAMLDAVQRVDLDSGTARVVARLPRPVGHEAVAVLRRRILVVGGRTEQHVLTRRMWWFDPGTRAFTRAGRLPTPCADAGLVVSGDDAYLLGGEAPDFSDRVVLLRRR